MSANAAIFNPTESTSAATGDGFSVPRLTTTGRLAITFTTSDKGMMVFDTTLNNLFIWTGSAWEAVPSSGDAGPDQAVQYNDNGIIVGDANFLWDKTLQRVRIGTTLDIWKGQLQDNTSTAVGNTALAATLAGATDNTAVGYRAMYRATTAANSVAVGVGSLSSLAMTGNNNTAVGIYAASKVTSGGFNTIIGTTAGQAITTGSSNVAIGDNALGNPAVISTAGDNIAIGRASMYSSNNITGADNVGIGRDTFRNLSSGADNVAIGRLSANSITSGTQNVAIGGSALQTSSVGTYAVAIGFGALNLSTADANVAIGAFACSSLTTGTNNVAIGYNACANTTTGSSNICIGRATATEAVNSNNQLVIGSSTYFVGTNGAANTYYATATAGAVALPAAAVGFWRVIINGTPRKIAVYAD